MHIIEPEGTLKWSSFIGGNGTEHIGEVATILGDPVFIGSTSTDGYSDDEGVPPTDGLFPNNGSNGWQHPHTEPVGLGDNNLFLVRISGDENTLYWSTFYGLTPSLQNSQYEDFKPSIACLSRFDPGHITTGAIYVSGTAKETNFPLQSSGGGYNQTYGGGYTDAFLGKFVQVEGYTSHEWSTFIGGEGTEEGRGLALHGSMDHHLVFTTGFSNITSLQDDDFCDEPAAGDFPICNSSGLNYMETDNSGATPRAYLLTFKSDQELGWSTEFGDGGYTQGMAVSAGNYKLFLAGWASNQWTEWQYDVVNDEDYWQDQNAGAWDATVARFDIPVIVSIIEDSIESDIDKDGFGVYPNPARNMLYLHWNAEFSYTEIMVFDVLGKEIYSQKNIGQTDLVTLDISRFAPGTYIVKMIKEDRVSTAKFIKE